MAEDNCITSASFTDKEAPKSPGAALEHLARDESARSEELHGLITFQVIQNPPPVIGADGRRQTAPSDPQILVWLIQLQSVFSMQLPRMPKEVGWPVY